MSKIQENEQMRVLFDGAIKLQQEIIADANRRIEHYNWALAEMDKQDAEEMEKMGIIDAEAVEVV